MATKKAAKSAKNVAKKATKTAATVPAKKKAPVKKGDPPAKKKLQEKKEPPAKKKPPAKRPRKPRGTPVVVSVDSSSLTLQSPPGTGTPTGYELLLFIDESKLTEPQMLAVEAFASALGLRLLSFTIAKTWGFP